MNKLENKIKEAVRPYMGMPVALSGGIDSGLLAALIKPEFAVTINLNELKYAKEIANYLQIPLNVINVDDSKFDEDMKYAVKIIGKPIPLFDIYPRYVFYKKLSEMGVKEIVLGDGPDETMCGYARDLIINYLYKVYDLEAFKNYKPLIDKILPSINVAISRAIEKETDYTNIVKAEIELKRPDMDDMSDRIAKYFGITNHRPYQDNKELDDYMRDLPIDEKIDGVEYGKYALRKIAEKYLPHKIAWRKEKVGMFYPVNKIKGWDKTEGNYGKKQWMEYQSKLLQ